MWSLHAESPAAMTSWRGPVVARRGLLCGGFLWCELDVKLGEPPCSAAVHRRPLGVDYPEVGDALQYFLKRTAQLEDGQGCADTAVDTMAERQMRIAFTRQAELFWLAELFGVIAASSIHQQYPVALPELMAVDVDVAAHSTAGCVERRLHA